MVQERFEKVDHSGKSAAGHHRETVLVDISLNGQPMRLPLGMPLASALLGADIRQLRKSPRDGAPRGAFCLMGACQECAIFIDGTLRQACLTPVRAGMAIELRGVP